MYEIREYTEALFTVLHYKRSVYWGTRERCERYIACHS